MSDAETPLQTIVSVTPVIYFQRRFPVSFHGSAAANVVAIVWFLAIVVGITPGPVQSLTRFDRRLTR